jgi:hypothetical protein
MPKCLVALAGSLLTLSFLMCPTTSAQTNKKFPTDDEIILVITQTERALSDYEASVAVEERLGGKEADVSNDKRVIHGLTVMSKAIKEQPQKFNAAAGFEFVLLLDDASRNAALCNADAIQKGIKVTMEGNTGAAQEYLQLAQSCTSASNLLYMVAENAGALYQRYVSGEESLAIEAVGTMNRCVEQLKQKK